LLIQIWHVFEHTLLFVQAQRGVIFFGARERTSVLQLFFPRIELHLFYNTLVTIPIVVAMLLYWRAQKDAVSSAANAPRAAGRERLGAEAAARLRSAESLSVNEGAQ
jgi:hypothetical protein